MSTVALRRHREPCPSAMRWERRAPGGTMHIVIIDDEAAVAETLAAAVRTQGHTARVVCSATESLAVLEANPPDAVFLDLVMPELSGVELLRQIRRHNPDLPIVVVTGRAEPGDLDEVRRLG